MSVAKLSKEKQKSLKKVSKAIYIIAKIVRVFAIIGVIFLVIGLAAGVAVTSKIGKSQDNLIEMKVNDDTTIKLEQVDDEIIMKANSEKIDIDDKEAQKSLKQVMKFFNENSKESIMAFVIVVMLINIAGIIVLIMILKKVENLFENIRNEDTPFTMENVDILKKIFNYMLASIIIPIVGNAATSFLVNADWDMNLSFSLIELLIVYCARHIFEYGYEIQQDSEGRIYGDENE